MQAMRINERHDQKEANGQVKDWLWRYRKAKLTVCRFEGEYRELTESQESAGAIAYDGMPGGSGNISDLSQMIIAKDACLSRLIKAVAKRDSIYCEISEALDQLPEEEQAVISHRYLQFDDGLKVRSWTAISSTIGYSETQIHEYHSNALQRLAVIIPE